MYARSKVSEWADGRTPFLQPQPLLTCRQCPLPASSRPDPAPTSLALNLTLHAAPPHRPVPCACPVPSTHTVRRVKLEEWVNEPFLEDTLPGCMVRVVGPQGGYLLAQVVTVETRPPGTYK